MKRKYWVLFITLIWILALDQWTKHSIQEKLLLHHHVEVIGGFFNLIHVRNPGGAFGIFGGESGGLGPLLFVLVSFIAVGIILFLFYRTREDEEILSLSFSLLLSGAIGNLIDRFRYGAVVDFLDFHISSFHWPAFNIADSAITIGIGLILVEILTRDHKKAPHGKHPMTNKSQ
jgi:signal peptidase II